MSSKEFSQVVGTIEALLPPMKKELLYLRRQSTLKTLNEIAHTMRSRGSSSASIQRAVEGFYEYLKREHDLPVSQEELKKITEASKRPVSIPKLEVPDPKRDEKIVAGCELYRSAPQRAKQGERTISMDEMTGVQALQLSRTR